MSFQINDGDDDSNIVTRDIEFVAVNDAPELSVIGTGPATFTENDPPLAITGTTTISDVDDINIESATVSIIGNFAMGEDVLSFTDQSGITGSYNASGVLSLTGSATLAQYQAAIQSVAYSNTSDDPSDLTRTVSFEINDGDDNSNIVTRDIEFVAVNDAPIAIGESITVSEDQTFSGTGTNNLLTNDTDIDSDSLLVNTTPVTAPANGQVLLGQNGQYSYTPDNNFHGSDSFVYEITDASGLSDTATVNIIVTPVNDEPFASEVTLTPFAEDSGTRLISQTELLSAANDVDGDFLSVTGLTISSGNGTLIDNQNGTWSYTPDADDDTEVSFTYAVTDGTVDVDTSATLDIIPVNDAPGLSNSEALPAVFTENSLPVNITNSLTLADIDNTTIDSATVAISNNFSASEDLLLFTDQSGISGSYNAADGILQLTGTASVADYELALRSVAYQNISDDPTELPRTIAISVSDGNLTSNLATRDIQISVTNDAPLIANIEGDMLTVAENSLPLPVSESLTITDADDININSAQVVISRNFIPGQDSLGFNDQSGIIGNYNPFNGVLTLTGSASVAQYETALRSVSYVNSSDNPSESIRTIDFLVNDGTSVSNIASRDLNVTPINDAPQLLTEDTSVDEGSERIITTDVLTASDVDDLLPDELTFSLISLPVNGTLTVGGSAAIAGSEFTLAQLQQDQLIYTHDGSETSTDFFDIQVIDGGEDGSIPTTGRFTFQINEVIDPIPSIDDESLILEHSGVFDSSQGSLLDSGESTLAFESLSDNPELVIAIESQPANGLLSLEPDGSFIYTHDGSNVFQDSFRYRVTNEDGVSATATVFIGIEPLQQSALEAPLLPEPITPLPVVPETEQINPALEVEQPAEVEENNTIEEFEDVLEEITDSEDTSQSQTEEDTSSDQPDLNLTNSSTTL